MLYDYGWNLSEVSRRPPAPADVIHLSYSGNRLVWISLDKHAEWLLFRLSRQLPVPILDGIDLVLREVA
jgi:hypothetical protein